MAEHSGFEFVKAFKENKVKLRRGQPWFYNVVVGEEEVNDEMLFVQDDAEIGAPSVKKCVSALTKLQESQEILAGCEARRAFGSTAMVSDLLKQCEVDHPQTSKK